MFQVAVIGGGVVGSAVAHALASRGVSLVLLEAEQELALGASGTNSGILHTGFDSSPGELETRLILRSAALRQDVLPKLGVPVLDCGAVVRPRDPGETAIVSGLAEGAARNAVQVELRADGSLFVPGESVTDPVAYSLGLAGTAEAGGAELRRGARVEAIETRDGGLTLSLAGGERLECSVAVNCAGLHADEVARMGGDDSFTVYPRKGEFFVFESPDGRPLERILLPVPTKRTKGVLVFPTVDGKIVAGPSAHDGEDKHDWSVRPDAAAEVLPKARQMLPALEGAEPFAAYAGLRPAGRGVNYVIEASAACPGLVHAAAIRSTGLTASLGIGEHVAGMVAELGVELGPARELAPGPSERVEASEPWWLRTSRHQGVTA